MTARRLLPLVGGADHCSGYSRPYSDQSLLPPKQVVDVGVDLDAVELPGTNQRQEGAETVVLAKEDQFFDDRLLVLVVTIGNRKDVYR